MSQKNRNLISDRGGHSTSIKVAHVYADTGLKELGMGTQPSTAKRLGLQSSVPDIMGADPLTLNVLDFL